MRFASTPSVLAGGLVAGIFAARAMTGAVGASSIDRGRELAANDRHVEAAPLLDRGAVGAQRTSGLWWGAQERLADWDMMPDIDQTGARGGDALRGAAARFLAGRVASPSSAASVAGLGQVYERRESLSRLRRIVDLADLDRGPWGLLGDDGRIAIGLTRAAIDREPNNVEYRDQLVLFLKALGLREEALRAIDDSARILPEFDGHVDFVFELLPRELVERFWQTSRSLDLREAPLQFRERHLLSLGSLARRLGHLEEAEQDLRAALASPGTEIYHAEDAFHLGLVLVDRGRFDEAETMLARADREAVFNLGVARTRARIAAKRKQWAEALEFLREARRLSPRDLGVLLEFAHAAQEAHRWDQAEEALRWSIVLYPDAPEPRRALVDMFLVNGEKQNARRELDEYVRVIGKNPESVAMGQAIAGALDPAGH